MFGRRKAAHIGSDLCENSSSRRFLYANDAGEQSHGFFKREELLLHLLLNLFNGCFEKIDMSQNSLQQKALVRPDTAIERFAQVGQFGSQSSTSEIRQCLCILFSSNESLDHQASTPA